MKKHYKWKKWGLVTSSIKSCVCSTFIKVVIQEKAVYLSTPCADATLNFTLPQEQHAAFKFNDRSRSSLDP